MQYRLSTLLLAFVVVWASLAVFGACWGIVVAAILLVIAVFYRSPELRPARPGLLFIPLIVFVLIALLLPAFPSARESARRIMCMNNLKQIGFALRDYEQTYGRLPPATVTDKQGQAMYSWRMLILPCLEGNAIYSKYSFREPWNGPNNSKLGTTCWPVFQCPSDPLINGRIPPTTSYVAVTGPGTVWDDHCTTGRPPRLMVVEVANSNINWMEPKDLTLGQACRGVGDGTGPRISGHHSISGGYFFQDEMVTNVLASDGSVWSIPVDLPPEIFRGLFVGDAKAWEACEEFQAARPHRINWTNCAALAVLILSYAVLLFRPRDKLPPPAEPATPRPPGHPRERVTSGGN